MGIETEMRRVRGFGDTTFVMLAREGAEALAGQHAPLPEAAYAFESQGDTGGAWRVRSFTATEGLSTVYECVVDLAHESLTANPDALLGRPAVLRVSREPLTRRFAGVVRRVEHRGTSATHRLARAYVVPALWALSQRSDSRVFQDKTAVEVVEAVLHEAGLYAGRLVVQVQRALATREYCVQHRETDLDFVMRLLAEEGVAFFFRHDDDGETLVLSDGAHAWTSVPTMDGAAIPVAGAESATQRVESVRHLAWERSLRPTGVTVRDFDFTRPDLRVERAAPRRRDPARPLYEPGPEVTLGGYQNPTYTADDAAEQAAVRYEAARVDEAVGAGEGAVTGMIPGAIFQLAVAGSHVPEQRYVVTRVEHRGSAPEELLQGTHEDPSSVDRYANTFQCIAVETPWRPARSVARPVIAGLQTAIVVGPPGEEIYTDEHGRIRVQFHWDRVGHRDERSTCWMRVVQGPWAGAGWGFQFIPRVGMEVAVSFLDGDPDRPVVTGALYNGQNRVAHALPAEKTRSAIRTQSSPNSQGYNELRFEDRAGAEEVYVHAQRDMVEEVLRCHSTRVGSIQQNVVGDSQIERVGRDQDVLVRRDQRIAVGGDRAVTVAGSESLKTLQGRESVTCAFSIDRVEGPAVRHVAQPGAGAGSGDHAVNGAIDRARTGQGGGPLETWVVEGDRTHRVTGAERVEVGERSTHVTQNDTLHISGDAIMSAGGTFAVIAHGAAPGPALGLSLDSYGSEIGLRRGSDGLNVGADFVRIGRVMESLLFTSDGSEMVAAEGSANVFASGGESVWGLEVSVDDESARLTSKDRSSVEVKRDVTLHAKGDLVLRNDGGASITLRASGEVVIRGTHISLRS